MVSGLPDHIGSIDLLYKSVYCITRRHPASRAGLHNAFLPSHLAVYWLPVHYELGGESTAHDPSSHYGVI